MLGGVGVMATEPLGAGRRDDPALPRLAEVVVEFPWLPVFGMASTTMGAGVTSMTEGAEVISATIGAGMTSMTHEQGAVVESATEEAGTVATVDDSSSPLL